MVQLFLGNSLVMPDQGLAAVAELHPLAVAGFIGCITNSLALLPLGHTDGGRISVSMFGRRGAFVVKLFTTLLLCLAGIFGFDDVNILLTYVLFASIWQRELETPLRNEVDELDFPRGLLGISAAILVGLTLIPMF
jgi:membrane-associated protease RseP (regulator of RpoE activity)